MRYALSLLERELSILEKIVLDSDWTNYNESLKDREKKIQELKKAIEILKC